MRRAVNQCDRPRLFGLVGLLVCGWLAGVAGAETGGTTVPPLLTSLSQLRHCAEQEPRVVHPFRIVGRVLDVDPARGVLALRDPSGVEFIRVDLGQGGIATGDILSLEGQGCGLKLARFGLAIEPGLVVDHDGTHPLTQESGRVFLARGTHPIRVEWFQWFGGLGLTVEYEGPGISRQRIPGSVLSRAAGEAGKTVPNRLAGLDYRYYEGVWELLPDFRSLEPVQVGSVPDFEARVWNRNDAFGLEYEGFLTIHQAGVYTFHLGSDDGSRLHVGQPVLDVRVLGREPVDGLEEPPAATALQANPRAWTTIEGTVISVGVWGEGGELRLRGEKDEIRVEVFASGGFAPFPPRSRVRVSGIYEDVLAENGVRAPGRLLALNWDAVKLLPPEVQVANPGGGDPPGGPTAAAGRTSPLRTAAEIKALPPELARQRLPVSLRGVVTAYSSKHTGLVLQDHTRGVFVEMSTWRGPDPVQRGEFCQIDGVTGSGWFAPVVVAERITRLGPGQMPIPLRATWEQLVNGSLDTEYAEMDGFVTAVQDRRLTLLIVGGRISVELPDFQPEVLPGYENALVRIRGCFFASFNVDNRKLEPGSVVVRAATVEVLEEAATDFFDTFQRSIGELLFYDPKAAPFRRLKVSGQVVHSRPGECFLTDGSNGVRVTTRSQDQLAVGDLVEAAGFLVLGGHAAELKGAQVRRLGHAPLPAPTRLLPDQLLSARHAGTLVQVDATLLSHWREADEEVLELQSGFLAFRTRVQHRGQSPDLPPSGSRLELTGVYVPQGVEAGGGTANGFELLLASPAAIRVLATPPWGTLRRMLVPAGILAVLLLAVVIWNKELQRKVQKRGHQLEIEIRNRQRAELERAAETERARIARDLHDELGTGLTELSLLSSASLAGGRDEEKIRTRFQVIAEKARHLVSNLDVIVWAVNPKHNSLQSFADYLESYTRELLAASGILCRCRMPIECGAVGLSGSVRHSLLLAIKETLNNALRHAAATQIALDMSCAHDHLEIVIADNGCGFDWKAIEPGQGLLNVQERLKNLGGECHIEPQLGRGTRVRLRVPLAPPAADAADTAKTCEIR